MNTSTRSIAAPRAAVLTADQCRSLGARLLELTTGGGETSIEFTCVSDGGIRWGRNLVSSAYSSGTHQIRVERWLDGRRSTNVVNQIDDASLAACIARVESLGKPLDPGGAPSWPPANTSYAAPPLRNAASVALTPELRSSAAYDTVTPALGKGHLAAGFLAMTDMATCVMNSRGLFTYFAETGVEFSTTIRNPEKRASGWAGVTSFDWAKIDSKALAARALDKCERSINPVGIEPGRYTAILEPQAVADLLRPVAWWDRYGAEHQQGLSVHWAGPKVGTTKLNQRVMDDRISVYSDPMDPDAGYRPFWYNGEPLSRVPWIERGVLTNLSYSVEYAKQTLHKEGGLFEPPNRAVHMTGGESTLEEMIATTERGVLVTRFTELRVLDKASLLSTANTRDGLWLVERGKISKPIRNFRFVDSPLFAFNNVEMLGKAVITYTPHPLFGTITPRMVPPMRVRDFNFSATLDAV